MNINDLLPSHLLESDFVVFAKLADLEFNDIELRIRELNKSSVYQMKSEFLKYFASNLGIDSDLIVEYLNRDNVRDAMANFTHILPYRGTAESIEQNCAYANVDGHILNGLFCFKEGHEALPEVKSVVLPRDLLFRWNRSKWSGEHKRAGTQVFKEGVVLVEVNEVNTVLVDKVIKVSPAGMQILFKVPKEDGTYEIIENYTVLKESDNK